jgi:hypothetical protein
MQRHGELPDTEFNFLVNELLGETQTKPTMQKPTQKPKQKPTQKPKQKPTELPDLYQYPGETHVCGYDPRWKSDHSFGYQPRMVVEEDGTVKMAAIEVVMRCFANVKREDEFGNIYAIEAIARSKLSSMCNDPLYGGEMLEVLVGKHMFDADLLHEVLVTRQGAKKLAMYFGNFHKKNTTETIDTEFDRVCRNTCRSCPSVVAGKVDMSEYCG